MRDNFLYHVKSISMWPAKAMPSNDRWTHPLTETQELALVWFELRG